MDGHDHVSSPATAGPTDVCGIPCHALFERSEAYQLQHEIVQEQSEGGGGVGEVEGYLWMRRWAADATREEAAAAVGGAMGKRKWCVVCPLTTILYFVRRS
jgi:hypothetical protein